MRFRRDVYDWIDPVEDLERALDEMNYREEQHEESMRSAARAFADMTYQIRRQAEQMLEPVYREMALKPPPPIFVQREKL